VEVPEDYCPGEASASKSGKEDKEDSVVNSNNRVRLPTFHHGDK
jgi:hypothetical protein